MPGVYHHKVSSSQRLLLPIGRSCKTKKNNNWKMSRRSRISPGASRIIQDVAFGDYDYYDEEEDDSYEPPAPKKKTAKKRAASAITSDQTQLPAQVSPVAPVVQKQVAEVALDVGSIQARPQVVRNAPVEQQHEATMERLGFEQPFRYSTLSHKKAKKKTEKRHPTDAQRHPMDIREMMARQAYDMNLSHLSEAVRKQLIESSRLYHEYD